LFLKNIAPEKIVARSILVYNLSVHKAQYEKLSELLSSLQKR
jgi:hypothetical protein